ncbi:MAG TPA: DUF1016 N-terminal domain-containing protein, partial [Segetibacter sp.]
MSNITVKANFLSEIKHLILEARQQVALSVNAEMSLLYWKVGQRIKTEILGNERAEYGKAILKSLSAALTAEYGMGWSEKQLLHC